MTRKLCVGLLALLALAGVVAAWDIVDQQQVTYPGGAGIVDNSTYYAQQFVPTQRVLSKVEFYAQRGGTPNGKLYLELRADNGNQPSSTVLATSSPVYCLTTIGWQSFDLSYANLTNGTPYWLVLRSPMTNGVVWSSSYMFGRTLSDVYTSGNFSSSANAGANWSTITGLDLTFKTYYATNYTDSFAATTGKNIIITTTWSGTGNVTVVLTRPAGTNVTEASMTTYERIQSSTSSNVKSGKVGIKRANFTADANGLWNYTVASDQLTAFTSTVEVN